MNICEECFYYGKTRFGAVCNYDGTYNPVKDECPSFKPKGRIEKEIKADIELSRLVISMVDRLIQISPKLKCLEDDELRGELLEVCFAAKHIKKMLE